MMMMNTNDKTTARPTGTPRLSEMDKADGEIDAPLDSTMGLAVDGDVERKADLEISELLEAPPPPTLPCAASRSRLRTPLLQKGGTSFAIRPGG